MSGVRSQVSGVTCQVSGVPCQVSHVIFLLLLVSEQLLKLVGGGYVINGAYSVKFFQEQLWFIDIKYWHTFHADQNLSVDLMHHWILLTNLQFLQNHYKKDHVYITFWSQLMSLLFIIIFFHYTLMKLGLLELDSHQVIYYYKVFFTN